MNSESNNKSRLKTTKQKLIVRFNGLGLLDWELIPRRVMRLIENIEIAYI
jgi:hypothetical protein